KKEIKKMDALTKAELMEVDEILSINTSHENSTFTLSLLNMVIIMGLGGIVSLFIAKSGITLPAYIGAMIIGAAFRNINDKTKWMTLDQKSIDFAGEIALNIFLTVALMDLKLWELFHLAIPLTAILVTQVIVVLLFALTITFLMMG